MPHFAGILHPIKPLIGITTSELRPGEQSTLRRHGEPPNPEMALGMTYVRAVEAADALAVVLPPLGRRDVPRLLARLDGLVIGALASAGLVLQELSRERVVHVLEVVERPRSVS